MSFARKPYAQIVSIAASDILNRGFFTLFNIYIARVIAPEYFGTYVLVISLGIWLWSFSDGGSTSYGIRLVAQRNDLSNVTSVITSNRLLLASITLLMYFIALVLVFKGVDDLIIFGSAALYVLGMVFFSSWVARGQQDVAGYFYSYFCVLVAGCAGWLVISIVEPDLNLAIVVRNAIWFFGGILGYLCLQGRYRYEFIYKPDYQAIKLTLPLGGAAIIYSLIPLLPQINMFASGDNSGLGAFASIWQIHQVLLVGGGVLSSVLLPIYSEALIFNKSKLSAILKRHFLMVFFFAAVLSVVYGSIGDSVISFVFGSAYSSSSKYLMLMSISIFLIYLRYSFDSVLIAEGLYRKMFTNGVVAVSIGIFSMALFVGEINAASIYLISELILFILNGVVFLKCTQKK